MRHRKRRQGGVTESAEELEELPRERSEDTRILPTLVETYEVVVGATESVCLGARPHSCLTIWCISHRVAGRPAIWSIRVLRVWWSSPSRSARWNLWNSRR